MEMIDRVREDIIDGLASGEVAEQSAAFKIERAPDGSILAAYDDETTFVVRVERVA